jgi:hypothetical protein
MKPFKKTVFLGTTDQGRLTVNINFDGEKLSITGSEGRDSGGQIIMHQWDFQTYAEGHNAETVKKLRDIWNKWHLNDMQAGSPAQTAFLEANPVPRAADYFTEASQKLKDAGLNPDPNYFNNGKPYRYGSAWLRVEIPAEALQYLQNLA